MQCPRRKVKWIVHFYPCEDMQCIQQLDWHAIGFVISSMLTMWHTCTQPQAPTPTAVIVKVLRYPTFQQWGSRLHLTLISTWWTLCGEGRWSQVRRVNYDHGWYDYVLWMTCTCGGLMGLLEVLYVNSRLELVECERQQPIDPGYNAKTHLKRNYTFSGQQSMITILNLPCSDGWYSARWFWGRCESFTMTFVKMTS